MFCYNDMTYCYNSEDQCENIQCHRHQCHLAHNTKGYPVCYSDFIGAGCKEFKKVETKEK